MLNRELLTETIEKFGISLSDEVFLRLDKYAEMLVETNKSFNLTAITDCDGVTVKHIAD
nr:class I SAM-dependent methyltransferase [Oscillospiraceae bacterium]